MTFASARTYAILTWLLPLLIVIGARDLLWRQVETVYGRIIAIGDVADRIRKTGVHIRELPEMKGDFERLAQKKTEIASSLFGPKSEASLYELLMLKARDASVTIAAVTPRPQRSDAGFVELPLSLEVTGSYDNLARFVNGIENVNRLMHVQEVDLARDRTGRLAASLRLLVYMYSDTIGTAKPAASVKSKQTAASQNRETYLADLANALAVKIAPSAAIYRPAGRGDPFGADQAMQPKNPADSAAAKKETIGFTLKGILWKDPPLAILESLDGRTYIVKQGEKINGFTVSSITRAEVGIATPQGNHVLHQYDQK